MAAVDEELGKERWGSGIDVTSNVVGSIRGIPCGAVRGGDGKAVVRIIILGGRTSKVINPDADNVYIAGLELEGTSVI